MLDAAEENIVAAVAKDILAMDVVDIDGDVEVANAP